MLFFYDMKNILHEYLLERGSARTFGSPLSHDRNLALHALLITRSLRQGANYPRTIQSWYIQVYLLQVHCKKFLKIHNRKLL